MRKSTAPRPPAPYSELEKILWLGRERNAEVIRAMQRRIARNPIRDFFWRRPWRSPFTPRLHIRGDLWNWLCNAHDCADPSVGCSCHGGYRFPR